MHRYQPIEGAIPMDWVRGWVLSCLCRSLRAFSLRILGIGLIGSYAASVGAADLEGIRLTDEAKQSILELQLEKESRPKAWRKLDSQLVYSLHASRGHSLGNALQHHRPRIASLHQDRVTIDVKAKITPALLQWILQNKGEILHASPRLSAVRVEMPLLALDGLVLREDVQSVRAADQATTNVGSQESEGGVTHGATSVRNRYGIDGSGIKVGVMSDSADFLSDVMASGDLGPVTIVPGQAGSGVGEGTAMLEIVHDIAPGAQLYFATAFNGEASFADNIRKLRDLGCKIIVDDVTYFRESPFQDGTIAQAVNDVSATGVLYFSSAGNSGNFTDGSSSTWEGDFVDGGAWSAGRGGRVHSFGSATFNTVQSGGGSRRVDFFWADPLGHSANDYDLYIVDSQGHVVASSTNVQDGNDDPYEFLDTLNVGDRIVVVKQKGEARFLHLDIGRGRLAIATTGSTRGHNASVASNAFCVAATWVGSTPALFTSGPLSQVERFSSDGPRKMFFNADGTPITPGVFTSGGGQVFLKPDLTAADGVSAATPGFKPFFGTSAAAPHAAAIAALLWSYNPTLTAQEVRAGLLSTALDIEAAGYDRDSGYGIVMPEPAIKAVRQPTARLALQSVALLDGNGNGHLDANECGELWFTLKNLLATTGNRASNVVGRLVSLDPHVVVDPSSRVFPEIAPSASESNAIPFQISSDSLLACDRPVAFELHISRPGEGEQVYPFLLTPVPSSKSGTPHVFASSDGPILIPDQGSTNASLQVTGLLTPISMVEVAVHIHHTYDSDLTLYLEGPDGTKVPLSLNQGASGADYGLSCDQPTVFSDAASARLPTSSAPFLGSYKPEQPLSAFTGKIGSSANGTWRLRMADVAEVDTGRLECWSLVFHLVECEDGGGRCLLPPSIASQPSDLIQGLGDLAQFQVVALGTAPLSYQWFFGTDPIPGANESVLKIFNVTPQSSGPYFVRVTNPYGSVDSSAAILSVAQSPFFLQQPPDLELSVGASGALVASVGGTPPFFYQWFQGPNSVVNATNPVLSFASIQTSQAGSYHLEVQSPFGSIVSRTVTVRVIEPPRITSLPADVVATNGSPASFTVGVAGTAPLHFFWFFNDGQFIPGSDSPTLSFSSVGLNDAGRYSVLVSNVAGSVRSGNASLEVLSAPVFTESPSNQVIAVGGATVLRSTVVGHPSPTIQWFVAKVASTNAILSGTNALLPLTSLVELDSGDYFAIASNSLGRATSGVAHLSVLGLPLITQNPQDQNVTFGSLAQFSVVVQGTGPFQYQWYKDGDSVGINATNAFYQVSSAQDPDQGSYYVTISNPVGTVQSAAAVLRVGLPPFFIAEPESAVTGVGGSVEFSTLALGSDPIQYQWSLLPNTLLISETNSSLTLSNLTVQQTGDYQVLVYNLFGSITSHVAHLDVLEAPTIVTPPSDQTVGEGSAAEFSVSVHGAAPFTYQWFHSGGAAVSGATGAKLQFPSVQRTDADSYYVVVSNQVGNAKSPSAKLTVLVAPTFTTQPHDGVAPVGGVAILSAVATGTEPLFYSWTHLGNPIPNATNATLMLSSLQPEDSGIYRVQVTNLIGQALSEPALLEVLDPPTFQFVPQIINSQAGSSLTINVDVSGALPLYFHWFYNTDTLIDGASDPSLVLPNATVSQSGLYRIEVSNRVGRILSTPISVRILDPVVIDLQPTNTVAPRESTVRFAVHATGSEPLIYQWYFNVTNVIPGGTNSQLVLSNVSSNHAGVYHVVVENDLTSVTSDAATLTVKEIPYILQPPSDTDVALGASALFTVNAIGLDAEGPLHYQWFFGGLFALADATNATLTIPSAQLSDAGTYTVEVSNQAGTNRAPAALLNVLIPPSIATQPADHFAALGGDFDLSVVAGGSPPFQYQWFFNQTTPIPDGTNDVLHIVGVNQSHQGPYLVVVSNRVGAATSEVAQVTVLDPVQVVTSPVSKRVVLGQPTSFEVQVQGAGPITYQWYFNQSDAIPGATGPVLLLSSVQPENTGSYRVLVMNPVGSALSEEAVLTVVVPPTATVSPADLAVATGGNATLVALTTGTPPLSYQWIYQGNQLLTDQTNSALQLKQVTDDLSGSYRVRVSNEAGDFLSDPATLSIYPAPSISAQPQPQTVNLGQTASFSVTAAGGGTLGYQWFFNSDQPLPGANGSKLDLSGVQVSQAGQYSVLVSNRVGSVTSSLARLEVITPPGISTSPVPLVIAVGADAHFQVSATGSEPLTYFWFFQSTNLMSITPSNEWILVSADLSNSGPYSVTVSNAAGQATSDDALLSVLRPPSIVTPPEAIAVALGQSAEFHVVADGDGTLVYQWFKDGNPVLVNGTAPTLLLSTVGAGDVGLYSVRITNEVGSITSDAVALEEAQPPVILTTLTDRIAALGSTLSWHVEAGGSAPLSYYWKNPAGNLISGATTDTLLLNNLQFGDAGLYSVVVSNRTGLTVSSQATLTVLEPPGISGQPQSLSVNIGQPISLQAQATGAQPLNYQWFFNGSTLIPGATSPSFSVASAQAKDSGFYTLVVSNVVGIATSAPAHVVVWFTPNILQQPSDLFVAKGSNALFSVQVEGGEPYSFQWFYNETNALADATNAFLVLSNADLAAAGKYSVAVTNPVGFVISRLADLQVLEVPQILVPPTGLTVVQGQDAHFEVQASDGGSLSYQWIFGDGVVLPGATNASLLLPSVQPGQAGLYSVIVSNLVGSAVSLPVELVVLVPPSFLFGPKDRAVARGTDAEFSASAVGTAPISYQWIFSANQVLLNQTNPVLHLSNVQLSDAGAYSVIISNAAGALTSLAAQLRVLDLPQIVKAPQSLAVATGTLARLTVEVSGSAPFSYQWYGDDGQPIAGATQPVLEFASAQPQNSGHYTVQVANEVGVITSPAALLRVLEPPTFAVQPPDQTVASGTQVEWDPVVTGAPQLVYQWFHPAGGNILNGANQATLIIPNVAGTDSGTYQLQVTNEVGVRLSRIATLTVLDPPILVVAPLSVTVQEGASASFTVAATGSQLQYQWIYNGSTAIPGATGPTLQLPNVQFSNVGDYSVIISNQVGVATSPAATLRVLVPAQIVSFAPNSDLISVSFIGLKGLRYTLQNSSTMEGGTWRISSGSLKRKGTGDVMTLFDGSPTPDFHFYRILVE